MYKNGYITLYLQSLNYQPITIESFITRREPNAFSKLGLSYTENGFAMFQGYSDMIFNEGKDFLIKGNVNVDVDTTDEKAISQTKKNIKDAGGMTIMTASYLDYGREKMHHWELSCK